MAQGELAYGAKKIESTTDVEYLKNEADRLRLQSACLIQLLLLVMALLFWQLLQNHLI